MDDKPQRTIPTVSTVGGQTNTKRDDNDTALGVVILVGLAVAGYYGYAWLFSSDRAQVRSCISAIMDASRGDVGYGGYRRQLLDLDAGDDVVITDEMRQPFGPDTIVTLYYTVDGNRSTIMCAQ
ncbi:MAG: hypothetical protein ACSHXB_04880 [Sulfitobacter sp.]